jgi:hypothetical protein
MAHPPGLWPGELFGGYRPLRLSKPQHRISLGPIRFDRSGDVQSRFHVFPAAADQAP